VSTPRERQCVANMPWSALFDSLNDREYMLTC